MIRDEHGNEFFSIACQNHSFGMPPLPYSVWCCDGRMDDGEGGLRHRPCADPGVQP